MACYGYEQEWWFAWRPVKTRTHGWVWWDWVIRRREIDSVARHHIPWTYGH
jgi:hypothetical protein